MASFFDNKARAAAATSSSKSKPTNEPVIAAVPWVEKYRPRSLEEVKSQEHATETLRRMVNASNLPHLLLYGPAGVGKTSTILALSRELFGPELMKTRVLEASFSFTSFLNIATMRLTSLNSSMLLTNVVSLSFASVLNNSPPYT